MKHILKKILPRPVLQAALDMRDRGRLGTVPRYNFDAAPLKPLASSTFLFARPETDQLWQDAHNNVSRVLGESHVFGGTNPGDRRALYYLITALSPLKVLEVGTHIGASTLYIAEALKNVGPDATVTTVDILDVNDPEQGAWKQLGLTKSPERAAEELGSAGRINFLAAPSLRYMEHTPEKYDFVFLDGDHSAPAVYREVSAALRLLNPGGMILLHDYYPDARPLFPDRNIIAGPFRALTRIINESPEIDVLPLGLLPWPTKQGSHATSLALVTRRT